MLRFQDYIVDATESAAKEAFRYAKAIPEDKVDWRPGEATRSVLDQCRELAMTPIWATVIIQGGTGPTDEERAAMEAEQQTWTTVEQCEAQCYARLAPLFQILKDVPDDKLNDTLWLPYDGGRDFTMVERMEYPRWNFNYHLGQIGYIQLMYGDKEMH